MTRTTVPVGLRHRLGPHEVENCAALTHTRGVSDHLPFPAECPCEGMLRRDYEPQSRLLSDSATSNRTAQSREGQERLHARQGEQCGPAGHGASAEQLCTSGV